MRIDKGRISGKQFMFAIACFIQSSGLLTSFVSGVTKQDSWLVILLGSIFSLLMLWVYRRLMIVFPDKNLLEIFEETYGKVIGKILGVLYLFFFFTLSALNLIDLGNFTKLTATRETPMVVLILMCIVVAAIAVRGGIDLVGKYSTAFSVVAVVIVIISTLLVVYQMDFENFLPSFRLPIIKYIQGTHIVTAIPFGELVVFLMIHPNVKQSNKEITKNLFIGFILGAITVFMVVLRDIAVLGNIMDVFTVPSLVTLHLANFGVSMSRIEILFAIILIILLFFKIVILYYVSVIAMAHLFKTKAYKRLVLSAGAFIVFYSMTLYPSGIAHSTSGQETIPFLWTVYEFIIPLVTIIVAKFKKNPKKQEA